MVLFQHESTLRHSPQPGFDALSLFHLTLTMPNTSYTIYKGCQGLILKGNKVKPMAQKERLAFSTQCSFKARDWIAALEAE